MRRTLNVVGSVNTRKTGDTDLISSFRKLLNNVCKDDVQELVRMPEFESLTERLPLARGH